MNTDHKPQSNVELRTFGLITGVMMVLIFGLALPWLFNRPFPTWPWLSQLQGLALALCMPALSHAAYRGRQGGAPDPQLSFLQEYFAFGFLFARDKLALPVLKASPDAAAWRTDRRDTCDHGVARRECLVCIRQTRFSP